MPNNVVNAANLGAFTTMQTFVFRYVKRFVTNKVFMEEATYDARVYPWPVADVKIFIACGSLQYDIDKLLQLLVGIANL